MPYFDFSNLIEQYSADFKVICEGEGGYDDSGEYINGEKTEYALHGAIIAYSENQIYRSEGKLTGHDKLLIMQEPINEALNVNVAVVIHNDKQYKIGSVLENAEFTGVYQYTLKYVSAFDKKEIGHDRL